MRGFFEQLVGAENAGAAMWVTIALVALLALLLVMRLLRGMSSGTFIMGGRNRRTRLAVMDATAVDANRRLVLVRRDDVEHLILIGGPTDVVVEQGIGAHSSAARSAAEPQAPVHEAPFAPVAPVAAPTHAAVPPPAPVQAPRPQPRVDPVPAPVDVEPRPTPPERQAELPEPPQRPVPPAPATAPLPVQPAPRPVASAPSLDVAPSRTQTVQPAPRRERPDPDLSRAIPTVTRGPAAAVVQARAEPGRVEPVLDAPAPQPVAAEPAPGIQSGQGPILSAYRVQKGSEDNGWVVRGRGEDAERRAEPAFAVEPEQRRDAAVAAPAQQAPAPTPQPAERDLDELALEEEMNRLLGDLSDPRR